MPEWTKAEEGSIWEERLEDEGVECRLRLLILEGVRECHWRVETWHPTRQMLAQAEGWAPTREAALPGINAAARQLRIWVGNQTRLPYTAPKRTR